LDKTGDQVRAFVDALHNLEDTSPATNILEKAIATYPNRYDLHLNLAALHLVNERADLASTELRKARSLADDPVVIANIDRLSLSTDNSDFERHLADLTVLVNAGKTLAVEDVDFLEEAIEKVPTFAEGYILLAKSYLVWEEPTTALETLLDGQKILSDDLNIIEMLARVLWEMGEHDLAFEYLNKGLGKNPSQVSLLALTGRYLFDSGQDEQAKTYLARAEIIDPYNSTLNEVRVYIARNIGE